MRARLAPLGALPLPLSPNTCLSCADHTSTMVLPPRPLIIGSARASIPAIAMAASTALPPCSSTPRPTRVTSGELELAIARPVNTGERRGRKAGLTMKACSAGDQAAVWLRRSGRAAVLVFS
jgi:hypothetical protein